MTLAEEQPVVVLSRRGPGTQVAAQTGESRPVAVEDQWPRRVAAGPEAAVRPQPEGGGVADRQRGCEVAGGGAQRAVGMAFLANQQLHLAVAADRGDRVFARPAGIAVERDLRDV